MNFLKFLSLALFFAQISVNAVEENADTQFKTLEMTHGHQTKQKTTGNHLYNFNDFETQTTINAGLPIPFNGPFIEEGAISQTGLNNFTITQSGHYLINVVADSILPTMVAPGPRPTINSGIILELNGESSGPGTPLGLLNSPIVLQQIVPIIASQFIPVNLRVLVNGTQLIFPIGPAVSITIIQLSQTGNLVE